MYINFIYKTCIRLSSVWLLLAPTISGRFDLINQKIRARNSAVNFYDVRDYDVRDYILNISLLLLSTFLSISFQNLQYT